ncbi:family 16 glycoside hydrolase [Puia sp. P3]|uniref:family 16 glycoside hydrolase n=1 Tax=Puia sp. P3 TaxID=3423952 RepID=UPI003D6772E4
MALFNGKDLKGWHASGATNQWQAVAGILKSPASGSNIITDGKYSDFKLHIEFRYPKESNKWCLSEGPL